MSGIPSAPPVTKERIADGLSRMGLGAGDVVFFHSSMRSIGWVEGGADTVIDAFTDVVGPEGLVIAPTFTCSFVGQDPERAFDPRATASRMGAITDRLWRRPGAHRSHHPTHSVAAIGRRAEELVRGHEHTSTFGQEGPYGRYVAWGAKILFLGVDNRRNTALHAIEDWLDLPYLQVERALLSRPDGSTRVVEVTESPSGGRDFYLEDSKVERLLRGQGLMRRGTVGAADAYWLPSQEMAEVVVKGICEEPALLLCDREDCEFCGKYRQPTIDYIRKHRPQVHI